MPSTAPYQQLSDKLQQHSDPANAGSECPYELDKTLTVRRK